MRDRSASEVGVLARQQQESNAEDAVGILRRIFYVLDFVRVLDTPRKMMNGVERYQEFDQIPQADHGAYVRIQFFKARDSNVLCRAWMPFQSAHHGCPVALQPTENWHDRKSCDVRTYHCTYRSAVTVWWQWWLCRSCFLFGVCYALGSTCRCGVGVDLLDRISAGGEDKIGISNAQQHLQEMLLPVHVP